MFVKAERRCHCHLLVLGLWGEADLGAHDELLWYCWCCWGDWSDRDHGLVLGLVAGCCIPPGYLHAHAPEPLSLLSFAANILDESLHYEGEHDSQDDSQEQAGALQLSLPIDIQEACITGGVRLLYDVPEDGTLACPLDIQRAHERYRRVLWASSCHMCFITHAVECCFR